MSDSDSTFDPTETSVPDIAVLDSLDSDNLTLTSEMTATVSKTPALKKVTSKVHEISDTDSDSDVTIDLQNSSSNLIHDLSDIDSDFEIGVETVSNEDDTVEENKKIIRNSKTPCKYGSKCYRKNPSHFEEFSHPLNLDGSDLKRKQTYEDDDAMKKIKLSETDRSKNLLSDVGDVASAKASHYTSHVPLVGNNLFTDGQPYSFFLTKVAGVKAVYNNTGAVSLKDILHPSMGTLVKSAQFNYMFEIPWIMQQYPVEFRACPLLLVHGFTRGDKAALDMEASVHDNIRLCQAKLDIMYGTHHSKMMLLQYDKGLRVVISTANLIERDWHQKTQGVWISPVFPKQSSPSGGDSHTYFKRDLLQYLGAYGARQLTQWIDLVKHHDMSAARVHLIGSSPGRHTGEMKNAFGHLKLRKVLEKNGPDSQKMKRWPVIGQFSSIGSLGANEDNWLCGEFYTSMSSCKGGGTSLGGNTNKLKLIYPTKDNVRLSLEGYPAGGSLPYSINTAKKQTYLHNYLHQWRSDVRGRSQASPHIKSYCRTSPDYEKMSWFLITSANLSKAAWGALEKKGSQLMIRSYEIGVMFLPHDFDESSDEFEVLQKSNEQTSGSLPLFPQPYDLPLTPYTKSDRPWIVDIAYTNLPDTNGNMWCPQ